MIETRRKGTRIARLAPRAAVLGVFLLGGCTWQGVQSWKRSTCDAFPDTDERAACLEEAEVSEDDYRRQVEEADE